MREFSLFRKPNHIRRTDLGNPDYPRVLLQIERPPKTLYYRGAPVWAQGSCLSVVGSREPCQESIEWMETELSRALRLRPLTVVSGGARGIDQQAHRIALMCGVPTICFQPVGLKATYPPDFQEMAEEIIDAGGTLVSPFPINYPLRKANFAIRNRWIAAFSPLVLVIEARRRSGTLLTAKHAVELDRQIATLPVSPMYRRGQGNLDLLFDGATMIRDAQDLVQAIDLAIIGNILGSTQIGLAESLGCAPQSPVGENAK